MRKVNKTQALLYIYDFIKKNNYLVKEEILRELQISSLTFARYIQELRAYFYNFYTGYEIIYNKKEGIYILNKNKS